MTCYGKGYQIEEVDLVIVTKKNFNFGSRTWDSIDFKKTLQLYILKNIRGKSEFKEAKEKITQKVTPY